MPVVAIIATKKIPVQYNTGELFLLTSQNRTRKLPLIRMNKVAREKNKIGRM